MARKINTQAVAREAREQQEATVKKTVVVPVSLNRLLNVTAAIQGLSDNEYVVKVIEASIPAEVRKLVEAELTQSNED